METAARPLNFSDEELVLQIVEHNNVLLFEELHDRHRVRVYNTCYGFAKNMAEAKDMAQDIFLKLFVKLRTFRHECKFSTWFYAFVNNHCKNHVSRCKTRQICTL